MVLRNMTAVYLFHEDKVLLIYRKGSRVFQGALWCGIGGRFENEELNAPRDCVLRELYEETGIRAADIDGLTLKYITFRKADQEIRQQYIYFARLTNAAVTLIDCDEGELRWMPVADIFALPISFTNTQCLRHYMALGRNDNFVYAGAAVVENGVPRMIFTPLEDFATDY